MEHIQSKVRVDCGTLPINTYDKRCGLLKSGRGRDEFDKSVGGPLFGNIREASIPTSWYVN